MNTTVLFLFVHFKESTSLQCEPSSVAPSSCEVTCDAEYPLCKSMRSWHSQRVTQNALNCDKNLSLFSSQKSVPVSSVIGCKSSSLYLMICCLMLVEEVFCLGLVVRHFERNLNTGCLYGVAASGSSITSSSASCSDWSSCLVCGKVHLTT